MLKKYDLVFGLGAACSCSQAVRRAGLQHLSFPNDWCGPDIWDNEHLPLEHDFRMRVDALVSKFEHHFDAGDFVNTGERGDKYLYRNRRTHCVLSHDFPKSVPFESALKAAEEKYRRRTERLFSLLREARHVLVVRIDRPDRPLPTPDDDCRYVLDRLSETFPQAEFHLVEFLFEKGLDFDRRRVETVADGWLRVSYDYHDYTPGKEPLETRIDLNARILAELFEVCDYRTPDEHRRHELERRKRRYAKYNATNWWQYQLARLISKLKR